MAREKPKESEELRYLRLVIGQDESKDNPKDATLANYRKQINEDRKWILSQKRIAEKEYRDELAAWRREGKKDAMAAAASAPQSVPATLEPCELIISRLIKEFESPSPVKQ